MLKHLTGTALALLLCLCAPAFTLAAPAPNPTAKDRVAALYTTWDKYYFYAGFTVNDPHVVGTNTTPISHPQQDDDVEVFFETNDARANIRTAHTYQMAVSAADGSYFSVGDGAKIPKAEAVYTYKYAATIDGSLNDNSNTDTGYTIELAIPWAELGLSGPPHSGEVWGFNALSRDRDTTAQPSQKFYSLSPNVTSATDVQNPSKWSRIVFDNGTLSQANSTVERVICPHVPLNRYPLINGSIVSGEWQSFSALSFGATAIDAPAPTVAEEPNTDESPFANPPPAPTGPPVKIPVATAPPPATPKPTKPTQTSSKYPNGIQLPNGLGSIKVVPGGIHAPPMVPTFTPDTTQTASLPPNSNMPGQHYNPLAPRRGKNYKPSASPVSLVGSLQLGPVTPPSLVMGVFRIDYNADSRKAPSQNVRDGRKGSLLIDQPMNGVGPWFTGLRPLWYKQQFADLRRSGIDIALIRARDSDPLLGRELDAMVEALKEMKASKLDYPLIGVDISSGDAPLEAIYAHIPAEFRATVPLAADQTAGLVVYAGDQRAPASLADGTALSVIPAASAAIVSPGRVDPTGAIDRNDGQTYADSWAAASKKKLQFVIMDSWNDFSHGTEVCATRQYGERYADNTRIFTNAFNGDHEWHAKYLASSVPTTIRPKTLYTIPIRIENAGTLPWRAGEQYALVPRWYKDGRLFDDSAPRVPVGDDVLPGQSITLKVGLVAVNGYGDDLDPGQYTLVFDMVQGDDRWFSYAGDSPLQVNVTVTKAGQPTPPQATFIGTETTTGGVAGGIYNAEVDVRNDGATPWSKELLAYKIQTVDPSTGAVRTIVESQGQSFGTTPIQPGQIAQVTVPVTLADAHSAPLPIGEYRLHWFVRPADATPVPGSYDEAIRVVASDPGANFVLSDIPRHIDAGKDTTAQIAVQNIGPTTWAKKSMAIGYHWYYLDGREAQWDTTDFTPLDKDIAPDGYAGNETVKFHAPVTPGRYALVFDMRSADGKWASLAPISKGDDILPVLVTVDGKGPVQTVDLSKYATLNGISGPDKAGNFDGAGDAFPVGALPPDGTSEIDTNPLLSGKAGPPLYPSGYYAAMVGSGWTSNHAVPFLYPVPRNGVPNMVACTGQTINLPDGNYKAVHLLAAATTASGQPVDANFGLQSGDQTTSQSLTIADWTQEPKGGSATEAFRCPYRIGKNGAEPTPCILGDYVLQPTAQGKITAITLPNNPAIKIVAISLVK